MISLTFMLGLLSIFRGLAWVATMYESALASSKCTWRRLESKMRGFLRGFGAKITPHNSLRRQPSAWPGACRKLERDRAVASVQQFNATEATMGRNANYAERDVRLFQPNHLSNNKFFRSFGPDSA
jgi:hypothetical protein